MPALKRTNDEYDKLDGTNNEHNKNQPSVGIFQLVSVAEGDSMMVLPRLQWPRLNSLKLAGFVEFLTLIILVIK